jgi:outer membrane protein
MFRTFLPAAIVSAAVLGAPVAALAQLAEPAFYLHAGPARLDLDEKASFTAGGQPVPGGNVSIDPQNTAALELGYFFTPNVAVSLTVGVPPKAKIDGAGSLAPMGRLGEITYGPSALTAHYHFTGMGAFRPYVGGGVSYMHVFDTEDGTVSNLEVENTYGPAVQVGAEYMFTDRIGAFVDFKKAWFSTESTGSLGPAPVRGDIQLDPAVVHGGLSFRF